MHQTNGKACVQQVYASGKYHLISTTKECDRKIHRRDDQLFFFFQKYIFRRGFLKRRNLCIHQFGYLVAFVEILCRSIIQAFNCLGVLKRSYKSFTGKIVYLDVLWRSQKSFTGAWMSCSVRRSITYAWMSCNLRRNPSQEHNSCIYLPGYLVAIVESFQEHHSCIHQPGCLVVFVESSAAA